MFCQPQLSWEHWEAHLLLIYSTMIFPGLTLSLEVRTAAPMYLSVLAKLASSLGWSLPTPWTCD